MASYQVNRNNVKYYSVELSTSHEEVSDGTTRVHASAHVSFGDWYYYGCRVHIAIGGVEVASATGYTTGSWQSCAYASGSRDISRGNSDGSCWVTAWVTSETVSGYGGVGTEIGRDACGESVSVPKIPAYQPAAPSGLSVSRSSDSSHKLAWMNNPDNGARKYYTGTNVYRHTNGGDTETLYSGSVISNYADNTTKADCRYDYDVRAQWRGGTSDMSNSVHALTTPAPPSSASVEKTGDRQAKLTVGPGGRYATGRQAQVTSDGGSTWSDVSLSWEKSGSGYVATDIAAPAGTIKYRVRNYIENPVNGGGDTLYSAWVQTDAITTICPPLSPPLSLSTQLCAIGTAVSVRWWPNHPDGTAQTAAQVEIAYPSSTKVADISGPATSLSFIASEVGTYSVRVRTKGMDASWGAWSAVFALNAFRPSQLAITSPATDAAVVELLPINFEWSAQDATGITSVTVSVRDSSSNAILGSATLPGDARRWTVWDIGLQNGGSYVFEVSVAAGSGLTSTASRKFAVKWAAPMPPMLRMEHWDDFSIVATVGFVQSDVSPVRSGGMVAKLVDAETISLRGHASYSNHGLRLRSSVPKTVSASVSRVYGGEVAQLASSLSDGQSVIDRLPPLNSEFFYRVAAFAANGATDFVDIPALVGSGGAMAFNFGQAAERAFCPKLDIETTASFERSAEGFHFADGGSMLPAFYAIDEYDEERGYSFSIVGEEDYRSYVSDVVKEWCGWVRGVHGERMWARLKWNASHSAHLPWAFSASCTATRGAWREPANG